MSRFRPSQPREVPALNTASLPDLIFTILFFFMLVTHMRPVPILTEFDTPTATELQKLEEKSKVFYLMVGKDRTIQFNAELVDMDELPAALQQARATVDPKELHEITVVLKIDRQTPMGMVNDLREVLRDAGMVTLHYSAEKEMDRPVSRYGK